MSSRRQSQLSSSAHHQSTRQNKANSAMSNREQNIGLGGLREWRHGQARSNGFELVAPDGAVGGLA